MESQLETYVKILREISTETTAIDYTNIIALCMELTKTYDESHNVQHHIDVFRNAMIIVADIDIKNRRMIEMITYSALLHDTIDNKYKENLEEKREILKKFLDAVVTIERQNIQWVIDNISYSKEVRNGYPEHTDPIVQQVRDIVSDADKLEAIGNIGIERCKQYTMAFNSNLTEEELVAEVIKHCNEKLLRLSEHFIRTKKGKELAAPLHQQIVEYCKSNSDYE